MMAHHYLKLFIDYFQPVVDGRKRSEVRLNDRDYQVGDTLTLCEGLMDDGEFNYTGRNVSCRITFIDNFGLNDGYVSLSIGDVGLLVVDDENDKYKDTRLFDDNGFPVIANDWIRRIR